MFSRRLMVSRIGGMRTSCFLRWGLCTGRCGGGRPHGGQYGFVGSPDPWACGLSCGLAQGGDICHSS
ncbi:unnamed protein product [Calypogeia fissa]